MRNKTRSFVNMTDKVADGIEANEELLLATEDGKRIMHGQQHLLEVSRTRHQEAIEAHQQRFKTIVTNGHLKHLCDSQVQELQTLRQQKAKWVERSFPSFAVVNIPNKSQHGPPRTAAQPRPQTANR